MYRVLLSLIRKRPRDLIKLCSEAATNARKFDRPCFQHRTSRRYLRNIHRARLQDTINVTEPNCQSIDRLLFEMKPTSLERKAALSYQYTTAQLLKKIRSNPAAW